MKKAVAILLSSLCVSPAFALGSAHSALTGALAGSRPASSLTLPSISNTLTVSGRGFGKGADVSKPVTLPGLGTVTTSYANTGKGGTSSLQLGFASTAASGSSTTAPLPGLSSYTANTSISKAGVSSDRALSVPGGAMTGLGGSRNVSMNAAPGTGFSRTVDGSLSGSGKTAALGSFTRDSALTTAKGNGFTGQSTVTHVDSTGAGKSAASNYSYSKAGGLKQGLSITPVTPAPAPTTASAPTDTGSAS